MSSAERPDRSLPQEQAESSRLAWAFALSLGMHILLFGTYHAGKKMEWWQEFQWPQLSSPKLLTKLLTRKDAPRKDAPQYPPELLPEVPLVFIDVNPQASVEEPPADAEFYSDKNAQAANPEPANESELPRIEGTQTEVVRTEEIPMERPTPKPADAEPPPPKPAPPPEPQPVPQQAAPLQAAAPPERENPVSPAPKPSPEPGELALSKPDAPPPAPSPVPSNETAVKKKRPRTIKEALARQTDTSLLPGEIMKQEGGTERTGVRSFDVRATSFGSYDRELIDAISTRWYGLLEDRSYASDRRGKVVLQFRLHYDGRISEMRVAENSAGEMLGLICQKAVLDPAPFPAWPMEMRRVLGDRRSIQFTFYYH